MTLSAKCGLVCDMTETRKNYSPYECEGYFGNKTKEIQNLINGLAFKQSEKDFATATNQLNGTLSSFRSSIEEIKKNKKGLLTAAEIVIWTKKTEEQLLILQIDYLFEYYRLNLDRLKAILDEKLRSEKVIFFIGNFRQNAANKIKEIEKSTLKDYEKEEYLVRLKSALEETEGFSRNKKD